MAASLLIAVVVAVVLADVAPRLAGTNSRVIAGGRPLTVAGGAEHCQEGQLPENAARMRVYGSAVGGGGSEPLTISIRHPSGAPLVSAALRGARPPGVIEIPLEPRRTEVAPVELCVRNEGARPMAFDGIHPRDLDADRPDAIRFDFYRPGQESWWRLAPVVAERFDQFKPPFVGAWTMWAALVLAVLLGMAAAAVVLTGPDDASDGS